MSADAPVTTPDLARTPPLATFAHGVAASFFAGMYAPNWVGFFAFFGGLVGAFLGPRLARSALRTPFLALPGLGVVLAAFLVERTLTRGDLVSGLLGPTATLRLGELVIFPFGALGVSLVLRALSTRLRAFLSLEVVAFGWLAIQLFVDHRFGAINRPFELADPMLATGHDPTLAFLGFGAFALGLVGLLLLRERSPLRAVYHLAILLGIVLCCVVTTSLGKLPHPEAGGGGRSEEEQQRGGRGGESGSSGRSPQGSQGRVPIAVVVFHDEYSTPLETYYFREETFSRFEGPRLVSGIDPDLVASPPTAPVDVAEPPPETMDRAVVETTIGMLVRQQGGHAIGLDSPVHYEPEVNSNPQRFSEVYRVRSRAPLLPYEELLERPVGSPTWTPEQAALYVTPHPDPRYRELALRIVEELLPPALRDQPVARAAAITTWLGREGQYSLHHLQEDGPDPASEFLFGERIGYCVHFAHSAVHLMRALGIPSRVGAGFAVAESERQGGSSLILMQSAAHAWPEIYVEGEGWMVADVFPQRNLEPPIPPGDVELARILGEMVRGETPPPPVQTPEAAEVIAAVARHAGNVGRLLLTLLALALAGLYGAKVARRLRPAFASEASLPRAAYRSVADALAESGVRRARGESRESFAARLAARVPAFVPVTELLEAEAFDGRWHRARIPELRALSSAARRELRRTVPLWRRVLAALDPISFLTAR